MTRFSHQLKVPHKCYSCHYCEPTPHRIVCRHLWLVERCSEMELLTLWSELERLCSSRVTGSLRSFWSSPPSTGRPVSLSPAGSRRSQRRPHRTCRVHTGQRVAPGGLRAPRGARGIRYSRDVALSVGQVLQQDVQAFVLLVEKLLSPPSKRHFVTIDSVLRLDLKSRKKK